MILVDTSIWIGHLRKSEPRLVLLLDQALVLMHPFVRGELACGNLKDRATLHEYWSFLPQAPIARDEETLQLVEDRRLWGTGIGWIDAHLFASALLAGTRLWTADKGLKSICEAAGVSFAEA